jgi:hypothetical protein
MTKTAHIEIEIEESFEDEVDDDTVEMFAKRVWEDRLDMLGRSNYTVTVDSVEH